MVKLTEEELQDALAKAPGWSLADDKLRCEYKFKDFVEAMDFVNQVALVAEESGHHPDIDIRYNRVELGLVTHDAGGITASDVSMAALLSRRFDGKNESP